MGTLTKAKIANSMNKLDFCEDFPMDSLIRWLVTTKTI